VVVSMIVLLVAAGRSVLSDLRLLSDRRWG